MGANIIIELLHIICTTLYVTMHVCICSYFTVGQCMYMATTKGEPGDGFQFTKDLFLKVYHHAS